MALAACADGPQEPAPFLRCDAVLAHAVGDTQRGRLAETDCQLDGRSADYYALRIDTLSTVRLYLSSESFDTYLVLLATAPAMPIASDDDGAAGTNSYLGQGLEPGTYVIAVQGASDADLGAYTLSSVAASPPAPTLLHPPPEYVVYQYADAPFCDDQSAFPFGYQIRYEWISVPGAFGYVLYRRGPTATAPRREDLSDTTYTDTSCGSYVSGPHESGWTWWVAATMADGTVLVSAHRLYDFTPAQQP